MLQVRGTFEFCCLGYEHHEAAHIVGKSIVNVTEMINRLTVRENDEHGPHDNPHNESLLPDAVSIDGFMRVHAHP